MLEAGLLWFWCWRFSGLLREDWGWEWLTQKKDGSWSVRVGEDCWLKVETTFWWYHWKEVEREKGRRSDAFKLQKEVPPKERISWIDRGALSAKRSRLFLLNSQNSPRSLGMLTSQSRGSESQSTASPTHSQHSSNASAESLLKGMTSFLSGPIFTFSTSNPVSMFSFLLDERTLQFDRLWVPLTLKFASSSWYGSLGVWSDQFIEVIGLLAASNGWSTWSKEGYGRGNEGKDIWWGERERSTICYWKMPRRFSPYLLPQPSSISLLFWKGGRRWSGWVDGFSSISSCLHVVLVSRSLDLKFSSPAFSSGPQRKRSSPLFPILYQFLSHPKCDGPFTFSSQR